MKPTLDLYIGRRIIGIEFGDEPWKWAIVLDGGVKIVNKSRRETIRPGDEILGYKLMSISQSARDTSVHFFGPSAVKITIGLMPTQYAILDPAYGGEVYPQWPEELEEAGIPSHPEEEVSAQPSDEWKAEEERLVTAQELRHISDAQEFVKEEE